MRRAMKCGVNQPILWLCEVVAQAAALALQDQQHPWRHASNQRSSQHLHICTLKLPLYGLTTLNALLATQLRHPWPNSPLVPCSLAVHYPDSGSFHHFSRGSLEYTLLTCGESGRSLVGRYSTVKSDPPSYSWTYVDTMHL